MAPQIRPALRAIWPALVAGLISAAATLVGGSLANVKLFADLVTEAATFLLGPEGFSFLLNQVGSNGKPLLSFGVILSQVAVFGFFSWWVNGRPSKRPAIEEEDGQGDEAWLRPILRQAAWTTGLFLLISILLVAFAEADLTIRNSWGEYGLLLAATSIFYLDGGSHVACLLPRCLRPGGSSTRRI